MKLRLVIESKGLTEAERKCLLKTIRIFNRKRKRDNEPRIPYKIMLG